jgi:hypothetical protein
MLHQTVRWLDVKTVFGIGGGYLGGDTFVTNIVLTREMVEKRQVERFMPVVNTFKTGTMSLVFAKKVFTQK